MSQKSDNRTVRIFSARACAAPLEKATKLFEEQTGIDVEISVCSRHCAKPVAEEATGETGGDEKTSFITLTAALDLFSQGCNCRREVSDVLGNVVFWLIFGGYLKKIGVFGVKFFLIIEGILVFWDDIDVLFHRFERDSMTR